MADAPAPAKRALRPLAEGHSPASPILTSPGSVSIDGRREFLQSEGPHGRMQGMAWTGRFEGMGAVVTGGASGIGLAVAKRIVAEGGKVTLWDVDQARLDAGVAEIGPQSRADRLNITDPAAVEKAASAAEISDGGNPHPRLQRGRRRPERSRCRLPDRGVEAGFRHQRERALLSATSSLRSS